MRQSFSSVRPETAEQPGPPAPRPGRGTHRRVERHAPQDRGDRMAAPGGRGLRGGHVVSATNVPSYDSGQSGRAEQTLNRLNVTFPPAESVLIQSRAPGRTLAGDPELRQATREAVAALRALPRSATDIRSPLSPGGRSLVETVQPPYHLFRRDIEADLLPYAQAHHIGVLAYGPLAHGLLGGTITEATTFGADDWRSQARRSPGPGSSTICKSSRRCAASPPTAAPPSPSSRWSGYWPTRPFRSPSSAPAPRPTSPRASAPSISPSARVTWPKSTASRQPRRRSVALPRKA